MTLPAFVVVALSASASWALLKVLIPRLRFRFMDHPVDRSSHNQPTPRGGGVVFVLVASLASALAFLESIRTDAFFHSLLIALLLAMPLAIVGFIDDRHDLPASWRYGAQLVTAFGIVLSSPLIAQHLKFSSVMVILSIGITAVINFTNFMDGLDGLLGGCMAIIIIAAGIQLAAPWPIWCLVGGLIGFLLLNWSPAKVFMGDVGSTFLGAVFAGLVLHSSTWSEALALFLVATPLLGDAFVCVPRRLMAGQHVFQAHRLHLFQRLNQAGWPHARVSSLYVTATAVLSIALFYGGLPWVITFSAVELLLGIWLDQRVAVPFALASRS